MAYCFAISDQSRLNRARYFPQAIRIVVTRLPRSGSMKQIPARFGSSAREAQDILHVGGFSDQVFEPITACASGKMRAEHWVGLIEAVAI